MFMARRSLFVTLLMLFIISACTTTTYENGVVVDTVPVKVSKKQTILKDNKSYSNLNFGLLAPLIGEWQVRDSQLQLDGQWLEQAGATWRFYPIQGGMSLEDEWVSGLNAGEQAPGYGTHLRVFDPMSRTWQSAWLSSRARSVELYRGKESETEVFFVSEPNAKGRITRTVFSNIQENFFNWRMEWSNDGGDSWLMVYKVDAIRIQ